MIRSILTSLTLIVFTSALAQFGSEQIISTNADRAMGVYAADIDGDGDQDVLSASRFDNKIAWYANLDGLGNFGPENIISNVELGGWAVIAADFDGDKDLDVISISNDANEIAWFENLDGTGSFGSRQVISNTFSPNSFYVADFDGDNDMDVVYASIQDGLIVKIENLDGLGNFGAPEVVLNLFGAYGVFLGDLDGDTDLDLISTSYVDGLIFWQENIDGLGNFGAAQTIITGENGASDVFAIDIDGDTDLDIVSASAIDAQIAWYENQDGLGTFGPQQLLSSSALDSWSIYPTDLDEDGDIDVLATSGLGDDKISWFENTDGLGNFGPEVIISSNNVEARKVFASDLDGDGDMDVLSASRGDDKIAWYENLTVLSVPNYTQFDLTLFPNPTTDRVTINLPDEVEILNVDVVNVWGQNISGPLTDRILELGALSAGIYYLIISTDKGKATKKLIKR